MPHRKPDSLAYATPRTHQVAPAGLRNRSLILLYALALITGFIAARVEYLNVAAGSYLPRNHPLDVGKWRAMPLDEARWRQAYGPQDASGAPVTRDLTPAERQQMQANIARMDANARLRDWVSSAGLLQYPLLAVLGIASLRAFCAGPTRRQLLALLPVAILFILAAASLWYRGYFSSLGG